MKKLRKNGSGQLTQAQKIREEEGRGCVQSMQFGLDALTEIQVCGSLIKLNFSQCVDGVVPIEC